MPSAFTIFLIAALLCVVMLLVLLSLLRSGIAGVREWTLANLLAGSAFILYAYGRELPPLIAYEAANGVYAAATAVLLLGFRRFFGRRPHTALLAGGVLLLVLAIAVFHYYIDSFALRTAAVSAYQAAIGVAIARTVRATHKTGIRSRYPYLFTQAMGIIIAIGHLLRAGIYAAHSGEITSLLQPTAWNLLFLSAGTMVLPVLTLGAVMIVHDVMMAIAEHAANRDYLTGAWSRRALFELAEAELTRSRRSGRALSLLVFDVDHFKSINDRFGHAAGDQVLVNVVLGASAAIRNGDFLGRIGGEEFAVLLPETNQPNALMVAERLRTSLHGMTINVGEHAQRGVAFSVSIGVAVLCPDEAFIGLMRHSIRQKWQAATGS